MVPIYEQLVNQVKNAYYSLLLANDSKRVIEENHETAKLNADIFAKKYENQNGERQKAKSRTTTT